MKKSVDGRQVDDGVDHRRDLGHRSSDTAALAPPMAARGRGAIVNEGARVIAYLAGEDARPVTGTVLAVDAGRVATL
jgi:hypothetical protein